MLPNDLRDWNLDYCGNEDKYHRPFIVGGYLFMFLNKCGLFAFAASYVAVFLKYAVPEFIGRNIWGKVGGGGPKQQKQ